MTRVKPAPARTVPFEPPREGYIPDDGADVELSTYYSRRVRDGDLIVVRTTARIKKPKGGPSG